MFNAAKRFLPLFLLLATFIFPAVVNADYVRIEGSVVNVRQGPGTSFPVLFQADAGEEYPLVSLEGLWCRIALDEGHEAWVFRRLVSVLQGTMPGSGKQIHEDSTKTEENGIGKFVWLGGLVLFGTIFALKRKRIIRYCTRRMREISGYRRESPFRYDENPPEKDQWEI